MNNLDKDFNNLDNPSGVEEIRMQSVNIGSILGLLVLIAVVVGTVIKFTQVAEKMTGIMNNVNVQNTVVIPGISNGNSGTAQDEKDNENIEDEQVSVDPYAKHATIEWATTEDTVKNIKIYIENGKIYSKDLDTGRIHDWKTIGVPKKIIFDPPAVSAVVLNEDGKVYSVSYDNSEQLTELSKYTIIDITNSPNYTFQNIYYLTSEGNLIDVNGVSYYKYGFVNSVGYGKMWQIPVDKNYYGYHYDYDIDEYVTITNKEKSKVSFAKIYTFEEYVLIQSSHGKLFKYDGDTNIVKQESDKNVSKIERKVVGDKTNIVVTFLDLTTKEYADVWDGYDVKQDKEIDINKLATYVEPVKEEPKKEEEPKDIIITNPVEELEKVSEALKQQILAGYDGKIFTGAEVVAIFQMYENSDLSLLLVTKGKDIACSGKYKLNENNLKVTNSKDATTVIEYKTYPGGVYYIGVAQNFDSNNKKTTLTELQSANGYGVNAAKAYYTSLIKDSAGDVCGILFMQR